MQPYQVRKWDGHDFIDASITAGAQVILCSTLPEAQIEGGELCYGSVTFLKI